MATNSISQAEYDRRVTAALKGSAEEIVRLRKLVKEYEKMDGLIDELLKIGAEGGDEAMARLLRDGTRPATVGGVA